MKSTAAIIVMLATWTASAAELQQNVQAITQKVQKDCQKELDAYCKGVSSGEGRVFACLYAYSDKLSGRCEHALYDAAAQLEKAVAKLNRVADSCANDIAQHCTDIKPGEGRIATCLTKNQDKITPACRQTMKDTGMAGK